jgi:hypothetical protein
MHRRIVSAKILLGGGCRQEDEALRKGCFSEEPIIGAARIVCVVN